MAYAYNAIDELFNGQQQKPNNTVIQKTLSAPGQSTASPGQGGGENPTTGQAMTAASNAAKVQKNLGIDPNNVQQETKQFTAPFQKPTNELYGLSRDLSTAEESYMDNVEASQSGIAPTQEQIESAISLGKGEDYDKVTRAVQGTNTFDTSPNKPFQAPSHGTTNRTDKDNFIAGDFGRIDAFLRSGGTGLAEATQQNQSPMYTRGEKLLDSSIFGRSDLTNAARDQTQKTYNTVAKRYNEEPEKVTHEAKVAYNNFAQDVTEATRGYLKGQSANILIPAVGQSERENAERMGFISPEQATADRVGRAYNVYNGITNQFKGPGTEGEPGPGQDYWDEMYKGVDSANFYNAAPGRVNWWDYLTPEQISRASSINQILGEPIVVGTERGDVNWDPDTAFDSDAYREALLSWMRQHPYTPPPPPSINSENDPGFEPVDQSTVPGENGTPAAPGDVGASYDPNYGYDDSEDGYEPVDDEDNPDGPTRTGGWPRGGIVGRYV